MKSKGWFQKAFPHTKVVWSSCVFLCYCFSFVFYENREGLGNPLQSGTSGNFTANGVYCMGDICLTCKQQKEFWNSKLCRLQNLDLKIGRPTKKIKFQDKNKASLVVEMDRGCFPSFPPYYIASWKIQQSCFYKKGVSRRRRCPFVALRPDLDLVV